MIPRYRALAKRIELELAVLDNTQQVARRHWQRSLIQETDRAFNEQVGTNCSDVNRVSRRILEAIVLQVAADNAFQNAARRPDRQNARIEHDKALGRVMLGLLKDDTESFKQFSGNTSVRRWLADMVCGMVYGEVRRRHKCDHSSLHNVINLRDAQEDTTVDIRQDDEERNAADQRKDAQPAIKLGDVVAQPVAGHDQDAIPERLEDKADQEEAIPGNARNARCEQHGDRHKADRCLGQHKQLGGLLVNVGAQALDQQFVLSNPAQTKENGTVSAKIAEQIPGEVRHRIADDGDDEDQIEAKNACPGHGACRHRDRRPLDEDQNEENDIAPYAQIGKCCGSDRIPDLLK